MRYVGIQLAPGSAERDVVGECLHGGVIELVVDGRVLESFAIGPGACVHVADGQTVAAGQRLATHEWIRTLRAVLPAGVEARAHFPHASHVHERVDEVTGLTRHVVHLPREAMSTPLELRDEAGSVIATLALIDEMAVRVREGDRVVCGTVLAASPTLAARWRPLDSLGALRRFLDARTVYGVPAASAPFDGEIERVDTDAVVLRGADARTLRIRVRRASWRHRPHDLVRAGDALSDGHRSHHRLLRTWGAPRLAEHLLDELDRESRHRALAIPRAYWSLLVRAALGWRRVIAPGDTGLRRNQVLAVDALARVHDATDARGGVRATVVPVLRGLASMARERG